MYHAMVDLDKLATLNQVDSETSNITMFLLPSTNEALYQEVTSFGGVLVCSLQICPFVAG